MKIYYLGVKIHPSIREINVNKEVLAIKRPLSEKLAYLMQQHEEPMKKNQFLHAIFLN